MVEGRRGAAGRAGQGRAALLAAVLTAVTWSAPPPAAAAPGCWDAVRGDVDGGGPDVVVGLPSFDLPGKPDAGALVVFSDLAAPGESDPRPAGRRTVVTAADVGLPTSAGARFGSAVVVVRRLGQACSDLLVGAPGETVAGHAGAGRVHWLPGTPQGLGPRLESFDEDGLPGLGGAQAGAGFGSAVVADGSDWFAVGVPGRDVGAATDAGRVVRVDRREPAGQRVDAVQQGGAGAGAPERGDRFGEVLEVAPSGVGPLLLVGVPREDVGSRADAGAVGLAVAGRPLTLVTQDIPGVRGVPERGDRFGSALAGVQLATVQDDEDSVHAVVLVTVPGEDDGSTSGSGMAHLGLPAGSVLLVPPVRQPGGGVGMVAPSVPLG